MESSTYREQLNRWAVVRLSGASAEHSSTQSSRGAWEVIARFRSWSDADGHLKFLHQQMPDAVLKVVFDVKPTTPQDSD